MVEALQETEVGQAREGSPSGRGGRRGSAQGSSLSYTHKCPSRDTGSLKLPKGGTVAQVKFPAPGQRRGGGKRGRVGGYSRQSRLNLLTWLNSWDRTRIAVQAVLFVTLTFHQVPAPRVAKRQLRAFLKRLQRAWGRWPVVWKLEPQKRGAPHFHLLVLMSKPFGEGEYEKWVTWCAQAWNEIAEPGDLVHLRWHLGQLGNKPCVEVMDSWDRVVSYVGKYVGKAVEIPAEVEVEENPEWAWQWPGRWWSCCNRGGVPITIAEVEIPGRVAYQTKRVLRRYVEHQPTSQVKVKVGKNNRGFLGTVLRFSMKDRAWRENWLPKFERWAAQDLREGVPAGERWQVTRYRRRSPRGREDWRRGIRVFMPVDQVQRVVRWAYADLLSQKCNDTVPF